MKPAWIFLLAASLMLAAVAHGATGDIRFSQSLNAADKASSGLNRLTSDQVAVIDALVRRDTTSRGSSSSSGGDEERARFSQRLTADERRIAGFATLSESELPQLDAFVDRFQAAKLARTLLAPPTYLARHAGLKPEAAKPEKKIHGSYSLSYGWGKGGYSEKTGSMVVNYVDPDRGFALSIGYSETHAKGGSIYRDPFYYDARHDPFYGTRNDPFYDARRDPFYDHRRDPFYDHRRGPDLREPFPLAPAP